MKNEVVLVPVAVARAILGVETETVSNMVADGRLLWVWDFGCGRTRRELRFWARELHALPQGLPEVNPAEVIHQVIGPTPAGRQRAALLKIRWMISPQHVRVLCDAGTLNGNREGHTRYLQRSSLEKFLRNRLVR